MNTTTNTNANDRITTEGRINDGGVTYLVNGEPASFTKPLFDDLSQVTFVAGPASTAYATHEVIDLMTGAIFHANGTLDADRLALRIAQAALFPALAKEQEGDFKSAQHLLAERDTARAKVSQIRSFIQASIDRGEWEDELDEIYWHELAEILDLDLRLEEEKEVTFTVTYTATVTVPKNADVDDLELDIESYPTVSYRGKDAGMAHWSDTEVTED